MPSVESAATQQTANPAVPLVVAVPLLVYLVLLLFLVILPLVIILMCLAPWAIWQSRKAEDSPAQVIRLAATITALIPVVGLGFFVPLRALAVAALDVSLFGRPPDPGLLTVMLVDQHIWGLRWLDSGYGLLGMALGVVGFLGFYISNLRLRRQIERLPTSTARAAAVGLVELQGVARRAEGHDLKYQEEVNRSRDKPADPWAYNPADAILFFGRQAYLSESRWSTFYLEDETGRILVDPRGVEFDFGTQVGFDFGTLNVRTILLEGNPKTFQKNGQFVSMLCPGDRVYLIGSAEPRDDALPNAADSERLVIRASRTEKLQDLWRWLVGRSETSALRTDFPDVFLLSGGDEVDTEDVLQRAVQPTFLLALVWIAAGAWLFVRASRW